MNALPKQRKSLKRQSQDSLYEPCSNDIFLNPNYQHQVDETLKLEARRKSSTSSIGSVHESSSVSLASTLPMLSGNVEDLETELQNNNNNPPHSISDIQASLALFDPKRRRTSIPGFNFSSSNSVSGLKRVSSAKNECIDEETVNHIVNYRFGATDESYKRYELSDHIYDKLFYRKRYHSNGSFLKYMIKANADNTFSVSAPLERMEESPASPMSVSKSEPNSANSSFHKNSTLG